MTKRTRTHSPGCNGKGNSMNARMKALLVTAALMLLAWHPAAHAEMSLYYIHNGHLGTPQVVTNEDQNVVWQADYQPFGEVDVTVNTLDQEARFPGQYTDDATGLHYNYFRDYDPSIGRYIQSDPIGLSDGVNTYAYTHNNPVNKYDPNGQSALHVGRLSYGIGRVTVTPAINFGVRLVTSGRAVSLGDLIYEAANGDPRIDSPSGLFNESSDEGGSCDVDGSVSDKKLSKGEIEKLKNSGFDPHDLKPRKNGSRFDLFKDRFGNIIIKPKKGNGPGDPTGINIKDF